MKKLMIIAITLMAAVNASAQIDEGNWYVTPKAGISVADLTGKQLYNFQLEARYNLGLVKVMKDDPEKSKNSVWQFTLGYKFDLGE